MKRIGFLVAVLALGCFSAFTEAEPPGKQGGPGAGQRGQRSARGGQQAGQGAGQRDPAKMVQVMMQRFDTDGDQKLDTKELTALLTAMRERGGQAGRGGGQGQQGQAGRRGGPGQAGQGQAGQAGKGNRPQGAAGGRRGQQGQEKAAPGGQRPRRPGAEEEV